MTRHHQFTSQKAHLSHLQKLPDTVHAGQELLVQVQSITALLLVHVEVLLEQVNDGIVVAGEQSNQVAKEKHEAHIDDTCGDKRRLITAGQQAHAITVR